MTVPSILSMYSVVQGYLISDSSSFYFDLWSEVTLISLLFVAFWSLAGAYFTSLLYIDFLCIDFTNSHGL